MHARRLAWLVALMLLAPSAARATGLTAPSPGVNALGRGGAYLASASDPMAVWFNPAILADLPSTQLYFGANLVDYRPCIQRSGTFGRYDPAFNPSPDDLDRVSSVGRYGDYVDEPFPDMCRRKALAITPSIVASLRLTDWMGIGFGVVSPTGSSQSRWGDLDGTVIGVTGERRPSPLRYNVIDQSSALTRATVGVGVSPTRWLRLGLSFLWGVSWAESLLHNPQFGGQPDQIDVRVDIDEMRDYFVPGLVASAHVRPHDNLDVAARFEWSDDVHTEGHANLTYAPYSTGFEVPNGAIPATVHVDRFRVRVPQPMSLRVGVRYAQRRFPSDEDRVERDPIHDVEWDAEVVFGYDLTERIDAFHITLIPGDVEIPTVQIEADGTQTVGSVPAGSGRTIPKGFRNQFLVYSGGSWNPIQDRLTLRAGLTWESRGIDPSMVQPDFIPARRVGLHAGLTLRVQRFDISLSYAHLFQEDIVAAEPRSGAPNAAEFAQGVSFGRGAIINAGRYRARWDIYGVGFNYRFGESTAEAHAAAEADAEAADERAPPVAP